jgi:hypothetical protein
MSRKKKVYRKFSIEFRAVVESDVFPVVRVSVNGNEVKGGDLSVSEERTDAVTG